MASDIEVQRLLCAIFPSRVEKVLGRIVLWAYTRFPDESLPSRLIGDRADDLRCFSYRTRARYKVWRKRKG